MRKVLNVRVQDSLLTPEPAEGEQPGRRMWTGVSKLDDETAEIQKSVVSGLIADLGRRLDNLDRAMEARRARSAALDARPPERRTADRAVLGGNLTRAERVISIAQNDAHNARAAAFWNR